jgi:hypothetical protein
MAAKRAACPYTRPTVGHAQTSSPGSAAFRFQACLGLRLRRTERELALSPPLMSPSAHYKDVGVRIASFRSSTAHPAYTPAYASLSPPRYQRKTRGRVDRYAFLLRILHSLLHRGLARRTAIATLQQFGPAGLPKPFICRELLVQFRFCRKVPGKGRGTASSPETPPLGVHC